MIGIVAQPHGRAEGLHRGFFRVVMLMGRNGIASATGWKINGVSGEVAETRHVHTVLMETGNWSDAGHRRAGG